MAEPPGVIVELADVTGDELPGWRRWYDEVYLPALAEVPGVVAARRAAGVTNPGPQAIKDADPLELLLLDLESAGVASSPELADAERRLADAHGERMRAHAAHTTRRVYRQIISTVENGYRPPECELIHGAFYEMAERHHEEFNDWYNTEHIPIQMTVPGYLNTRRFQAVEEPERFVALYDVEKLENTRGPAARRAMESAWSDRIRDKLATSRARRLFAVEATVVANGR
jgi:hypothetical protein